MSVLLNATISSHMSTSLSTSTSVPRLPPLPANGTMNKTASVDDLMGNVTAFKYTDLKDGLRNIKDPEVQTRTLLQARMVLGSVNTMMPDGNAPSTMLPPPLDTIWLALPQSIRPKVQELHKAVTHEAERGVRPADAMAKQLVSTERFIVLRQAALGQEKKLSVPSLLESCPDLYGALDMGTLAAAVLMAHDRERGDLAGCGLRDIAVTLLGCWRRLQFLTLAGNERLTDLSPLTACSMLEELDCSRCVRINDLTPLGQLKQFKTLRFSSCVGFRRGSMLPASNSLEVLYLTHCSNLQDLENLAWCPSLSKIEVGCCKSLQSIRALAGLQNLRSVSICSCLNLSASCLEHLDPDRVENLDLQLNRQIACGDILEFARRMCADKPDPEDPKNPDKVKRTMPYIVWPDKDGFDEFCKEQNFQRSDQKELQMLYFKLRRGYRDAAETKLRSLLTEFDALQLRHAIDLGEEYDLDERLLAKGQRREAQLTRGMQRADWLTGFRRLAFTDVAEDSFDYVNAAMEQWVILEDFEEALGHGGPASLEELEEFHSWATSLHPRKLGPSGEIEERAQEEVFQQFYADLTGGEPAAMSVELFAEQLQELGWQKPNAPEIWTALTSQTKALTPIGMHAANFFLAARQMLQVDEFRDFVMRKFVNPTKAYKQMAELAQAEQAKLKLKLRHDDEGGISGEHIFEKVAAQCGWANSAAAQTVYRWLEKDSLMKNIKLPAFEYLHKLAPKQVLKDMDRLRRFCVAEHGSMAKAFDKMIPVCFQLRKEKMKRDMLRAATRDARQNEREERYRELQKIRGVTVEENTVQQGGGDEDEVSGSMWTSLRAKDDLRQHKFDLDEQISWFFCYELQQIFPVLQFPGTIDLQSLFNFCDTEHTNKMSRGAWEALEGFNPYAALRDTTKGCKFIVKAAENLPKSYAQLREVSTGHRSHRRSTHGFASAVMGVMQSNTMARAMRGPAHKQKPQREVRFDGPKKRAEGQKARFEGAG